MGNKIIDKICSDCGTLMKNINASKVCCDECAKIRKRKSKQKYEDKIKSINKLTNKNEYENNFAILAENIENLLPNNFNSNSKLKVKSYCQFYDCTWIDILKLFNKYDLVYEKIKNKFIEFNNNGRRSIKGFCDYINISYDILLQFNIAQLHEDCNIKYVRYNNEDLANNVNEIKNKLGHIPLYNEFMENTKITLITYSNKFKLKGNIYDNLIKTLFDEIEYEEYLNSKKNHKIKTGQQNNKSEYKYSLQEMEIEFKNIFDNCKKEYDTYPSKRYFNIISKIDESMYRSRFNKSWLDICSMYGYTIDKESNKTEKIVLSLIKNIIGEEYVPQKTWGWLIGNGGGHLYCDGYFESLNLVVEFDGRQHRKPIDKFGGEEAFKKLKENDKLKEKLLQEHNINIIRIDSREKWYDDEYLKQRLLKVGILITQRTS